MFNRKSVISNFIIIILFSLIISCGGGGEQQTVVGDPGYFTNYYIKNNSNFEITIKAYNTFNGDILQLMEKTLPINKKVNFYIFGELGGGVYREPSNAFNKISLSINISGIDTIVYEHNYTTMSDIKIKDSNKLWLHQDTGNNYSLDLILTINDTNLTFK